MKVLIGHGSALEYLRTDSSALRDPALARMFDAPPPDCVADPDIVELLGLERLGIANKPVHLFAADRRMQRSPSCAICHTPRTFPPRSKFLLATDGVFVSAPPTTFLHLAPSFSVAQLALLGCELCGSYAVRESEGRTVLEQREPICSSHELRSYADMACQVRAYGARKAAIAARFVLGNAASPAEAALALLLTLPSTFGGFGLPAPLLNYRIDVSGKGRGTPAYRICDAYWPQWGIDLEYDSDLYHTGSDRIASDAVRRNELASKGLFIITVTRQQLYDVEGLRKVAEQLAKLMGKRLRIRVDEFSKKHQQLRQALLFSDLVPQRRRRG